MHSSSSIIIIRISSASSLFAYHFPPVIDVASYIVGIGRHRYRNLGSWVGCRMASLWIRICFRLGGGFGLRGSYICFRFWVDGWIDPLINGQTDSLTWVCYGLANVLPLHLTQQCCVAWPVCLCGWPLCCWGLAHVLPPVFFLIKS